MVLHEYSANLGGTGLSIDCVRDVGRGKMEDRWLSQQELELRKSYELLLSQGKKFLGYFLEVSSVRRAAKVARFFTYRR